jgi:predicted RND superfamily exporter protein
MMHDARVSAPAELPIKRPGRVLAVALAATVALLPLVLRVRLDTDVVDLFPQKSAEARAFARFSRAFAGEQNLLVLVECDDGARLTAFADAYAAELRRSPLVAEVRFRLSAAAATLVRDHLVQLLDDEELKEAARKLAPGAVEAQSRRLRGLLAAPGGSSLAPLLTADPLELLPQLGQRLSHGMPVDAQSGYFRSGDGRALILYVRPHAPTNDVAADRALIADATAAAERLGARVAADGRFGEPGRQVVVGFTSACAFWLFYQDWLHRDMQLSTLLSGIAVLALFGLFFRAVRALPLVALPLGVGLVWTAAAAQLLYGRVNAVSLAFGTILLSIGIDLPIQLYNRLREELAARPPLEALTVTVRELAAPSLAATLGPGVVFFACGLSNYRGLSELGLLAGIGLMFNWLAMLTVFPALLALLPARWWAIGARAPSGGLLAAIGRLAGRRPKRVLALAALVGVAAVPLALRTRFDRRLLAQPPSMPPVRVQAELEQRFGERERALIVLVEDGDRERALERGDAWLAVIERLRKEGAVRSYSSTASLFPAPSTQARRQARLAEFAGPGAAARLRQALAGAGFATDAFAHFLAQLEAPTPPLTFADPAARELDFLIRAHVHDDPTHRLLALYVYAAPGAQERVAAALRAFAQSDGAIITGAPILEDTLHGILSSDTLRVTVISAGAVALLLALYFRRLRPWLAVMLPLVLAWIGFAAALALAHLPLNLYNLLSVPLVIGYGIDDHIFLVQRWQSEPTIDGARLLATTGRAIVLTSLSTMAGFAGLAVAHFDGLRLLGLSGSLAVLFCLLAAFAVLPALLALLYKSE